MYKLFVIKSFSWFELLMYALLCVSFNAINQLMGDIAGCLFSVIAAVSILFINSFVAATIQAIDEYYNNSIKGNEYEKKK